MQGMGRHSLEDVRKMMKEDIRYFADFLENKKYLMGDIVSSKDCFSDHSLIKCQFITIVCDRKRLAQQSFIKPIFCYQISEVDCVAFGFMALGKFAPITAENLVEVHPNINDYVERIKGELYPDWNELIKKKQTINHSLVDTNR